MRKTIYTLLLSLFILILFTTCKNPEIDYNTFSITSENILAERNKVLVSGEYDFLGEVLSMKINIGLEEQLSDAESYSLNLEKHSFSITIENLDPGLSYYYCYVVEFDNSHKLLTDVGVFTTLSDKPVVRTLEVKAINPSTFRVKSIVEEDCGLDITERGVCWGFADNPTFNDNHLAHQENGLGEYTCTITGLELDTIYYVRAYAKNQMGLSYAEEVLRFETNLFEKPIVETLPMDATAYTQTSAVCKGRIVNEGSSPVTQRGICWGITPNPDIDGEYVLSNSNENNFYVLLTNLSPSTTYYYCAYAINYNEEMGFGEIIKFTTLDPNKFRIEVSCSPAEGGQVVGGGEFVEGENCVLDATANAHYEFHNWTESGQIVFEEEHYSFPVDCNRTLIANFSPKVYHVSVIVSPSNAGTIDGDGNYEYNQTCTLRATPNEGFEFDNWTDNNGNLVFSDNPYEFNVTADKQLFANFKPQAPEGAINGLFSVSSSQKVFFSKGNLQYQAHPYQRWSFADNQYDHIGENNNNISSNYDGWIDLFGWGTGNNPTNTGSNNDYHDWGDNPISNGGNTAGLWRTLTKKEWNYVFKERRASTINGVEDARYIKATVNNVKGVILFPDEYDSSGISIQTSIINKPDASFNNNNNTYSINQWLIMEGKGCVFLPVTGCRYVINTQDYDTKGAYWSSSDSGSTALGLRFDDSSLNTEYGSSKTVGQGVRLVHPL